MLGRAVARHWRLRDAAVLALPRALADITRPETLTAAVDRFRPELILNCAAFTRVDDCESQREHALEVNGHALAHVVAAAERAEADLVHISSDYVFDGRSEVPYREDDPTGPPSVYGESKLLGEREALRYERTLVVRASWLFGPGGPNFVATMARLMASAEGPLRVVDDQVGGPTYTPFLARALWDLTRARARGVVHYQNRDAVSWHGFACEIAQILNIAVEIQPVTSEEFPRPAPRPAFSVLDLERFRGMTERGVEPWLAGLTAYLDDSGDCS
jgi:dTDP-4-dehydrorhamnose reductase